MKTFINRYYKYDFGSPMYISGLPLPDPEEGPYKFVRCTFHPGILDTLDRDYRDSTFEDCDR